MGNRTRRKLPPGPSPESWTASFKSYSRDPLSFMPQLVRDYGDIVTMRYYNFRVYFISHPDFIEQVLVAHNRKFIKGRILRKNRRLFGDGLLTSEGDFWLRQRRLAQPAFHRARIASYADTMVKYADRLLAEWKDGEQPVSYTHLDVYKRQTRRRGRLRHGVFANAATKPSSFHRSKSEMRPPSLVRGFSLALAAEIVYFSSPWSQSPIPTLTFGHAA